MKLNPALIRIGLRYTAGALVAYGVVSAETAQTLQNDPMVTEAVNEAAGFAVGAVGVAIGAATEVIYGLAKKWGWRT